MQKQKKPFSLLAFIRPHRAGFITSTVLAVLSVASGMAVSYTHLDVYKRQGLYRGLSAPLVYQRKLFGVCRPDDGRWLYGHHGGPADLAGVRGHCTEHSGRFCSGLLAGYEAHA